MFDYVRVVNFCIIITIIAVTVEMILTEVAACWVLLFL